MIRAAIIILALLVPNSASASYVASCDLSGTVTSAPVRIRTKGPDLPGPSFTFQVSKSTAPKEPGRNDIDCARFAKERIIVTLPAGAETPAEGDQLNLNIFLTDSVLIPMTRTFTVIPPTQ